MGLRANTDLAPPAPSGPWTRTEAPGRSGLERSSPEAEPEHRRPCPLCFLTASVLLKGSRKASSRAEACQEHKHVHFSLTYPSGCGPCVLTNTSVTTQLEPSALVLFCSPIPRLSPWQTEFLEVSLISLELRT